MLTVLEVEIHRLKRGGQVWAAATTSLKNWDRKVFFFGGGLFVCSWNARRGTVEGRGRHGDDARHVVRKHRDFVLSVETGRDGERLTQK